VKLSVKSDYAARAILGLARHFASGKAVRVEDLAGEQSIPSNYLIQILIELKSAGIVRSVRGKEGGYLLARPPVQVTLGDVLRAVHGAVMEAPALASSDCPVELKDAWRKLQQAAELAADKLNFQELAEHSAAKDRMYYI